MVSRAAFTRSHRSLKHRPGDLSFGWTLDWATAGGTRHGFRHGPFLEGVWFLRQGAGSPSEHWRFGPSALAELSFSPVDQDDEPPPGFGVAGGILLEYADFVRGPIIGGGVHGDIGFGLHPRRRATRTAAAASPSSAEFRLPGAMRPSRSRSAGTVVPVGEKRWPVLRWRPARSRRRPASGRRRGELLTGMGGGQSYFLLDIDRLLDGAELLATAPASRRPGSDTTADGSGRDRAAARPRWTVRPATQFAGFRG
jgi:hypothetical protein